MYSSTISYYNKDAYKDCLCCTFLVKSLRERVEGKVFLGLFLMAQNVKKILFYNN